jgi:hypothetical protein
LDVAEADRAQAPVAPPAAARLEPGNRPPDFEVPPVTAAAPGEAVAFGVHAIDQDSDSVVIDVVRKPAGASWDAVTKTIRWTPTAKDAPAGQFRVQITETQRKAGGRRTFFHDFAIAVVPGAKQPATARLLGPAVEQLITIHDPERLVAVNKDFPITRMFEAVAKIEQAKLPAGERTQTAAPDARQLYRGAMGQMALRHQNDRADPAAKAFEAKVFGDPAAWKITAVRPRLDKAVMELRVVYENVRAPEPVYLMFRFRLVRDLPPGELAPEAVAQNNEAFVRLTLEHFFTGGALNPKHGSDKKAHGQAVSKFVAAVLGFTSDKHPQLGAEFIALPHEARFGGGTLRGDGGMAQAGDGWAWAVLKAKWVKPEGGGPAVLEMVSVPIPGFTTDVRPSDDGQKWRTVCAPKFDPDSPKRVAGYEVLCRKKQGFTDLPAVAGGKVTSGAVDSTHLYVEHKTADMVATVALADPRRDNFEENGMTCSQCHVRNFGNGDPRDPAVRDPRQGRVPPPGAPLATNFFSLVPETTWQPFMLEFQELQECLFRDAIERIAKLDTDLVCPLVAEAP